MKEVILAKYGEIALKGLNKSSFERVLLSRLTARLRSIGAFSVEHAQSTVYITPENGGNIDEALDAVRKIYGFTAVSRAVEVEKDVEALRTAARAYIPPYLDGKGSFKVEGKRADKRFPLNSMQLSALLGGDILEATPGIKVDVHNPDVTVMVEIRDYAAYLHAGTFPGAGGIPVGSGGKGLLLLSGGIDSPVAGCMMAKRGLVIDAVHFQSPPYTSEQALEKVIALARIMSDWCGVVHLRVVKLTEIQERLRDCCDEEYFTLLLRRSMMRIASRLAAWRGCGCLITGESLGQVASQTMPAMAATEDAASIPVFRPCIGLDKEEIVVRARELGTFETSILPYEDCCTVFTPRHPKTRPELAKVREQETRLDLAPLEDAAIESLEKFTVGE